MSDHKVYNTPLLKKIGIKVDQSVFLNDSPSFILSMMEGEHISFDLTLNPSVRYDLIWTFVHTIAKMQQQLLKYKKNMHSNGMIWVSWYKKSSKKPSELNENIIRDTALSMGLVDIKVASVDEQWSALKLVIPVKDRVA